MIHKLRTDGTTIFFTVITEIGKANCTIQLTDLDSDCRPKCFADEYEVLGVKYDNEVHFNRFCMGEGIKRISNAVRDICDNNGWNLWSY